MRPAVGDTVVTTGGIAKAAGLLERPPTVTTTSPEAAPAGTGTVIADVVQLAGTAATPPKLTVLAPWTAPNPLPMMVTTAPIAGKRLEMAGTTANATVLLTKPPTLTATGPEEAAGGTATRIADALHDN